MSAITANKSLSICASWPCAGWPTILVAARDALVRYHDHPAGLARGGPLPFAANHRGWKRCNAGTGRGESRDGCGRGLHRARLGYGRAAAVLFAREGAKVFAVDKDADSMKETVERVGNDGEVSTYVCDVLDDAQVAAMTQACRD